MASLTGFLASLLHSPINNRRWSATIQHGLALSVCTAGMLATSTTFAGGVHCHGQSAFAKAEPYILAACANGGLMAGKVSQAIPVHFCALHFFMARLK